MDTIRFETTVGEDHVIRPPEGITIPPGRALITVSPCAVPVEPEKPEGATLRDKLLAWAAHMEKLNPELPSDLAANHDFYAHGKPRE